MQGAVIVIGKAIVIAAIAGFLAAASSLVVTGSLDAFLPVILPFAMLGSYGVGLPISLLTYFLARKSIGGSLLIVLMLANLAGVMIMLTSVSLLGPYAALVFGVPSLIAANTYALLGWVWIIRQRPQTN